jgi:hypothetical protein
MIMKPIGFTKPQVSAGGVSTDTGWVFVGTGTQDGTGDKYWSNIAPYLLSNITADDTSYARVSNLDTAEVTSRLKGTMLGNLLVIPGAATITGVEFVIALDPGSGDQIYASEVKLIVGGSVTGANKAVYEIFSAPMTEYTYGGAGDMWGLTTAELTPAALNLGTFGLSFQATEDDVGNNNILDCDFMKVKVYYTT